MRRLLALVKGLPPGGALHRAVDPAATWGTTEELLAALCELVDQGNRLFVQAHSKKGTRPPRPIKIHRPAEPAPARRRQATVEELSAFLGRG